MCICAWCHVNIPVNSNDLHMLEIAEEAAMRVMAEAQEMGGAVSGEHGIGISKRSYFLRETAQENLAVMNTIKTALDPKHILNDQKSYIVGGK